jgi:putative addiction module antidote
MNRPLKLIPIGNSTGAIFPKDMLQELGVAEGDVLFPVRTPNGIELRRADPEFIEEMKLAREIMRRRHNVLRELAK